METAFERLHNAQTEAEMADDPPMTEDELVINNWFWLKYAEELGIPETELSSLVGQYGNDEHWFFRREERDEHLDATALAKLAEEVREIEDHGAPLTDPRLIKLYEDMKAALPDPLEEKH